MNLIKSIRNTHIYVLNLTLENKLELISVLLSHVGGENNFSTMWVLFLYVISLHQSRILNVFVLNCVECRRSIDRRMRCQTLNLGGTLPELQPQNYILSAVTSLYFSEPVSLVILWG